MAVLFDFDSIKDRLVTSLKTKTSWEQLLFFSTNNYLINLFAEEIATLATHDEFLTRETKWDIAKNKTSLHTQAKFRGYIIKRKQGAVGNVRVSKSSDLVTQSDFDSGIVYNLGDKVVYLDKLYQANTGSPSGNPDVSADWTYIDNTHSTTISIKKFDVFSTVAGLQFVATSPVTLTTSEEVKDVPVAQGTPITFTQNADGDDFEVVTISDTDIEDAVYEVYINDELFTQIDNIFNATEKQKVYQLKTLSDESGIELKFGNDGFGYKLTDSDFVKVIYITTAGSEGNVSSINSITVVNSTILDGNAAEIVMFVNNKEAIDGGKDEDSLEETRAKGVDTFQAGQRATTNADYKVFLDDDENVQQSTVWGAYENAIDNGLNLWDWIPTEENLVNISVVPVVGTVLTDSQKIEIIDAIKDLKAPTDILSFFDAEYIYLSFTVSAFVADTSKILSTVQTDINDLLTTNYDVSNQLFKGAIYDTQWKGEISAIDGVSHHTSSLEMIDFQTFNTSFYEADIALPLIPINTGSIEIFVKDTTLSSNPFIKIATDDGAGGFTPEAGYVVTGSTVNYTTGLGYLKVVSGLSATFTDYSIKIYYTPTSLDFLLTERNQIFIFDEIKTLTVNYDT